MWVCVKGWQLLEVSSDEPDPGLSRTQIFVPGLEMAAFTAARHQLGLHGRVEHPNYVNG